jgi:hypothetical protein
MPINPCWGFQFGGIPAAFSDDGRELESAIVERVEDFLHRHGNSAPATRTAGTTDQGLYGWIEVTARDGGVLRIEWSKSPLRFTLAATERAAQGPDAAFNWLRRSLFSARNCRSFDSMLSNIG